jgi:tetratricopeptide (TPR) repeat protein
MPRRRTQDVVEVVMTDHLIQRGPPAPDLLAPREEREPVLEDAFALEPERAPGGALGELYRALAVVRIAGGASPAAVDRLAALAVELAPGEPAVEGELVRAQLQLGRLDDAEEALERWRRQRPDDLLSIELAGLLAAGRGRNEEAVALLTRAAAAAAPRPEALFNLGAVFARLGRAPDAEVALERAVALRPTFAAAWVRLGELRAERGDTAAAALAQRRALAIEPRLTRAYLALAAALAAGGRSEEARSVLAHGARHAAEPEAVAAALAAAEAAAGPALRRGPGPPPGPAGRPPPPGTPPPAPRR